MTITHHASERGKERVVPDVKAFEKLALKAWYKGCKQEDFKPGKMHDFMAALFLYNGKAGGIRLYGNHAFIFNFSGVLITVLHIPHTHLKYKNYLKKNGQESLSSMPETM